MSKRLQVLLDESEYRELERTARRQRMTVSAFVRRALRELQRAEPAREPQRKLQVVREASRHSYPAPDIEQMLAEIEHGYTGGAEE